MRVSGGSSSQPDSASHRAGFDVCALCVRGVFAELLGAFVLVYVFAMHGFLR